MHDDHRPPVVTVCAWLPLPPSRSPEYHYRHHHYLAASGPSPSHLTPHPLHNLYHHHHNTDAAP
ncbi:hypothetical protein D0861_07130 [Hortaea werneckii]|uniref:Uncharacterized protein n=1 Tax=Hortaea werneckii TaxID=91943 RepID=A0A3M7F5E8_HORWE|nr:hypothetical protein D0861_07130 [Hortaea werneckii]